MSRERRRLQWFYIGPLLLWMLVIFLASSQAGGSRNSYDLLLSLLSLLDSKEAGSLSPDALDQVNLIVRKAAHVTEYALLTLLALRAFQFGEPRPKPRSFFLAGALGVLYSMGDEFHQHFVPGRTATPRDVVIDSVGILLVLLGSALWFALKTLERQLLKTRG